MTSMQEAPALEEPQDSTPTSVPTEPVAERNRPHGLALVGVIVGIVVVAAALFGGGILVGLAIGGSSGATQGQLTSPGGQGGFGGQGTQGGFGGQGGQRGFGGGQGGQQGGTQGGQGTQNGGTQNGGQGSSSNS